MRMPSVRSVFAATVCLALAACAPSGARSTPSMVPARVNQAVDIGALDGARPITLVLGVKTHDQDLLDLTVAQARADRARR